MFIFNLKAVLKAIISFKLINPLQAKTAQTALKRKIEHIENGDDSKWVGIVVDMLQVDAP